MMASPPTEGEEGEEQILVLVIRRFTILRRFLTRTSSLIYCCVSRVAFLETGYWFKSGRAGFSATYLQFKVANDKKRPNALTLESSSYALGFATFLQNLPRQTDYKRAFSWMPIKQCL